jgi:fimbrial isopeptide formation D2 family protein
MKRKKFIGLMMALLMVFSTFTIVNAVNVKKKQLNCISTSNYYFCDIGSIDFTKAIWDEVEGDWEESTWAESGDTVRFNISLTYHKDPENPNNWALHHIVISDELPDCLEFADNVTIEITGSSSISYTEETAGNWIIWTFSDYEPMLYDNESLYLEFDATVSDSEFIENENVVYIEASECNQYDHEDNDNAWVFIEPVPEPESTFEKKVLDGDVWSEETNVTVGSVVTFSINLTYFGDEYLHDISIIDYLPCCLEYEGNSNIEPSYVSDDLKTIWWNFTDILTDGQSINITFDALVTGTTGCGCDGINNAMVEAYEGCLNEPFFTEDDAKINATCGDPNVPPCWPLIEGDKTGEVGEELSFVVMTYDYDNDNVYYQIDWDDETPQEWIGPFPSGEPQEINHTWNQEGTYNITAKAKDIHDAESEWGNVWTVEITAGNSPPNAPTISGDTGGKVDEELTFTVSAIDPDEDNVYYQIDWDDETPQEWIGPFPSGEPQEVNHTWDQEGTYNITAKAKDIHDAESDWGENHTVEINGSQNSPANLKIKLKVISLGKVTASISNEGAENVSELNWSITVKRFRILKNRRTIAEVNGKITNLTAGSKIDISTGKKSIRFKFGLAKVTITAEAEGQQIEPLNQHVLIIGRIILARPKLLGI